MLGVWVGVKLQALVYDILPSTTAVFSYAIRSRKLSGNEQFLVGTETVASLLHITQIISDVCFITNRVAYTSSIFFLNCLNRGGTLLFFTGVDVSHVYVHAWVLGCCHSLISTQTFWRALTASVGR